MVAHSEIRLQASHRLPSAECLTCSMTALRVLYPGCKPYIIQPSLQQLVLLTDSLLTQGDLQNAVFVIKDSSKSISKIYLSLLE